MKRFRRYNLITLLVVCVGAVGPVAHAQPRGYEDTFDKLFKITGLTQTARRDSVVIGDLTHIIRFIGQFVGTFSGVADSATAAQRADSALTWAAFADSAPVAAFADSAARADTCRACAVADTALHGGGGGISKMVATYTWLEPDVVAAIANGTAVTFLHLPAEAYPSGVVLSFLAIDASAAISDTFVVQEWSDPIGTSKSAIDTIALVAANRAEVTTGWDDSLLAADSHLALLFKSGGCVDDITALKLTVVYEAQ